MISNHLDKINNLFYKFIVKIYIINYLNINFIDIKNKIKINKSFIIKDINIISSFYFILKSI